MTGGEGSARGAGRPRRRRRSLLTQLTVLTVVVAVLAVLVTFVVAFPLIRESAESQAQRQLVTQANLVADLVEARSIATVGSDNQLPQLRSVLAGEKVDVAVVADIDDVPDLLTEADRVALGEGLPVGGVRTHEDRRYLVQARAAFPFAVVVLTQPVSVARSNVEGNGLRRVAIALLVGGIIAALAGAVLARRFSRPLERVQEATARLGRGERSVQVDPAGPREVAEVAEALNALTAALTVSEARQRDFLLSVSHELRTPLTAVRGYAEALADGVVEGDEVRPAAGVVRDEARRLDRLVTDLLDLARVGARDLRLDLEPVDLGELVESAATVWRRRGAQEGVEVRSELPALSDRSDLPARSTGPAVDLVVRTDRTRLRQIIDNLTENALRVTPEGAELVLAVRTAGPDEVVVEVLDRGPGLTDEDIAIAFEPAALHERYRAVRQAGSGVGLALVARLSERLGGRAEAARRPDGGACFGVRLPRGGPAPGDFSD